MSQHEKNAWWGLGSGILIWLFLAMRFTDGGRVVELPPGQALEAYVSVVVLWILAACAPGVIGPGKPADEAMDERDRAIDALGDRREGNVVLVAVNVLVVHALANDYYTDRLPSIPRLDLDSTSTLVFVLLSVLFLADAVRQSVIVWQYRR